MASCQITDLPSDIWLAFRRLCLDEKISANRKLRQLIEEYVRLADSEFQRKRDNSTEGN